MSSQADSGIARNAVVCYFPDLPYYLRYQIGFDIILNPPEANADSSEAGEPHRLIHVELFFPDGFISSPATFAGMPHPRPFERGAPHFFTRDHNFNPSMHSDSPHLTPHFDHVPPLESEEPMLSQEHHHSRVFVHVSNGQLGECMSIDNSPYFLFPQCNRCGEFYREPGHTDNHPSQDVPRMPTYNPHNQVGHSHLHPSAPGITGQMVMSHAVPFAPHFFPSRPAVYPPMYPDSTFVHLIPMVIEEIWEERRHVVRNRQPGQLMIEDTARVTIPQPNMHGEVLRQPGNIHNNPPQGMPAQKRRKRPRQSIQHPSTSGITDTDHSGLLQNEDHSYLTQSTEQEIEMLPESLQEIQRKNHTATSASTDPTANIARLMNLLDVDDEKNEENVPKDNQKPGDDPNGNNDN